MKRKAEVIKLDAIDNKGRPRKVQLRATLIGGESDDIRKQDPSPRLAEEVPGPTSNADERDPFATQGFTQHGVIAPRYNLEQLSHQKERSTELGQNIAAMVTNIVGFGWQLREVQMPEGFREKYKDEIQDERFRLLSLLDSVHPVMSLTAVRRKIKDDQHSCGNGYMELIDNQRGELVGVNHVLGHTVRLTEKDKKPTRVEVPRVRPDKNYTVEQVPMYYRFRKYGIVRSGKPLWFKEAGDPRTLDKRSGKYEDNLPFSRRATSLIHFHNYSPMTPYGLPLWIGNLFSVYGSRQAEEINYSTLANNAVPSMFVICENGALTDASIERLREWTEEQIQKSLNRSKFILLEGEAMEEGAPTPSTFKIRVEPLKNLQQDDQLFQAYDQNNRDKLRQAFRLPPLFVGRSEDYTRATADTSRDIADEQVFAPERTEDDWMINRFVLQRWGSRYHFLRSNHPNITDDIELIRLMAIAEKSGAMTPRRADRIVRDVFGDNIGPMPSGIDLDKPFSITFAEAQQGASSPGGGDTATRVVENLLELRTKIEKELDRRYYLEEEDEV